MNAKPGFSHPRLLAILLTSTLALSAQNGGQANQPAAAQEPKAAKPGGGRKGPYLYNQRLDQQAQLVQKMASEVTNSQLFQAELDNLDMLSKYSAERIFSSARRAALATLDATFIWKDISDRVTKWQDTLLNVKPDDWTAQQEDLKKKIAAAKAEIEAARPKSPTAPQILEVLASASDANEFFKLADGLVAKNIGDGITTTDLRIAKQLADSAGRVAAILTDLYKPSSIPRASDAVRDMQLSLLQAELEHITNEARIQSARESALHDLRLLLRAVSWGVSCLKTGQRTPAGGNCLTSVEDANRIIAFAATDRVRPNEQIENTMRRFVRKAVLARRNADACLAVQLGGANRDCTMEETTASDEKQKLQFLVYLLQNWSSLAARAATPGRLAAARLAQEERRYSIRRDGILARSYEAVIGSGAQRLAAYYKGGIKPETIAQFVQALSTAGLIPTVALK